MKFLRLGNLDFLRDTFIDTNLGLLRRWITATVICSKGFCGEGTAWDVGPTVVAAVGGDVALIGKIGRTADGAAVGAVEIVEPGDKIQRLHSKITKSM